jgi:hypothetical protein
VRAKVTLRAALNDPELLGTVLEGDSWKLWRTILIAANGEPLTDDERRDFEKFTGRTTPPTQRVSELQCVIGRRGGKSRAISTLACYYGALCEHKLARGERGVVLLIAQDRRAAKVSLDYIEACFDSPMLRQMVKERHKEELYLTNGISIEVRSPTIRSTRGITAVAVLCDELAFWRPDEASANPDVEVVNAARPALATTQGPLVGISSPYGRRGFLWDSYKKHFGPEGDPSVLIVQGASRDFNPSLPQSVVDAALKRDALANSAEYLGLFRTDVEALLTQEAIEAVTDPGIRERAPDLRNNYLAFVDPSGGSSDSMTLAISHPEGDTQILDLIREVKPPFSPEAVVEEFASTMRRYRVSRCFGDRYAGNWPSDAFMKCQIHLEPCERSKSELYVDLLPAVNSRAVRLLENERLMMQLVGLERTTRGGGKDKVDHARGSHDDVANAVAGALVLCRDEVTYSPAQRLKDNLKLEAAYKRLARSFA